MTPVMEGKGRGAGLKLSSERLFLLFFCFCALALSFSGRCLAVNYILYPQCRLIVCLLLTRTCIAKKKIVLVLVFGSCII